MKSSYSCPRGQLRPLTGPATKPETRQQNRTKATQVVVTERSRQHVTPIRAGEAPCQQHADWTKLVTTRHDGKERLTICWEESRECRLRHHHRDDLRRVSTGISLQGATMTYRLVGVLGVVGAEAVTLVFLGVLGGAATYD